MKLGTLAFLFALVGVLTFLYVKRAEERADGIALVRHPLLYGFAPDRVSSVRIDNVSTRQAWIAEGATNGDGRATVSVTTAPPGAYRTTVTNVRAEGLTWDGVLRPSAFRK